MREPYRSTPSAGRETHVALAIHARGSRRSGRAARPGSPDANLELLFRPRRIHAMLTSCPAEPTWTPSITVDRPTSRSGRATSTRIRATRAGSARPPVAGSRSSSGPRLDVSHLVPHARAPATTTGGRAEPARVARILVDVARPLRDVGPVDRDRRCPCRLGRAGREHRNGFGAGGKGAPGGVRATWARRTARPSGSSRVGMAKATCVSRPALGVERYALAWCTRMRRSDQQVRRRSFCQGTGSFTTVASRWRWRHWRAAEWQRVGRDRSAKADSPDSIERRAAHAPVAVKRPEQVKTPHDLSSIFSARRDRRPRVPEPAEAGQELRFDFYRDPLNSDSPIRTLRDSCKHSPPTSQRHAGAARPPRAALRFTRGSTPW